jgi:hypothetical protein
MRLRALLTIGAALSVAAASACRGNGDRSAGGDTIAMPAGAVDTTARAQTDSAGATVQTGTPGAGTAASGNAKATGVDTPITRRLRSSEPARPSP